MADWMTVRHNPAYEEKIDPEVLPLCDALNAAGFETIASCCGHGTGWPYVYWKDDGDARSIARARAVLAAGEGDGTP